MDVTKTAKLESQNTSCVHKTIHLLADYWFIMKINTGHRLLSDCPQQGLVGVYDAQAGVGLNSNHVTDK